MKLSEKTPLTGLMMCHLIAEARRPPAATGPRGARRVSPVNLVSLADATGGAEAAGATRRSPPTSATAGYLLPTWHASACACVPPTCA